MSDEALARIRIPCSDDVSSTRYHLTSQRLWGRPARYTAGHGAHGGAVQDRHAHAV